LRLFVVTLSRLIVLIVDTARRFAWPTIVALVALAVAGLAYSTQHLRMDSNTDDLFASSLPWRQAQIQDSRNFPQFSDLIVAVVRAKTPEEAHETAAALNAALSQDKANFIDSKYPAGSAFYAREGLLLLPTDRLVQLLTSIVAAQPFLGQLAADPSARGLFTGLGLIAQGVSTGANLTPYQAALEGVRKNLAAAAAGHPEPLSWQSLIAGGVGAQDVEFVLAHPRLDRGTLQPGGVATAALVRIANSLPDVKAGRATVNYTGQVPLADEQFASLTQGLVVGGIISVLLIALWLFLALRSWRLIVPILATLLLGLALTVSFTAVFIGVVNLISVAFAILFIGLAVDFAIQFCVRLRDVRHGLTDLGRAIPETARQAGGQIALAATATACGFFAFAPTPFVGVAELGVIAGAGMFIALFCTITFLPALLWLFRPGGEALPVVLPLGAPMDRALQRGRRPVLLTFAVLALAGAASAATMSFDANPLDTKDPHSESMRTLKKLISNPATNPFYAQALAPNLAAARALQARFAKLPEVAGTLSGGTFVPEQQAQKLAMLAQAKTILAPTLLAADSAPPAVTVASIRAAMATAHDAIMQVAGKLPKGSPLLGIAAVLAQLQSASDTQVMAMNAAVTRFLPDELQRLSASLSAQPITTASLPAQVAADWFLPDGRVRVEVFPTQEAQSTAGLHRFVKAVLEVAPDAGGPAVSTVATADTILYSFREAAALAFIAIAVILVAVFRNLRDTLLVLATLALSALLTALFAKLWGLSINYANIIALPLLLGVGVSFNVYFVMNFRAGMRKFLSSATAHAVLFSALTTSTAFGSLAASHDRGTASMGILLLLSLAAVLISTFIFLPAMLYTLSAEADRRAAMPERDARKA
jgi:uncharacterized protein